MVRKHCGKRTNCSLRAIFPFPTLFSKDLYCRHVKTRACLGKGQVIIEHSAFFIEFVRFYKFLKFVVLERVNRLIG